MAGDGAYLVFAVPPAHGHRGGHLYHGDCGQRGIGPGESDYSPDRASFCIAVDIADLRVIWLDYQRSHVMVGFSSGAAFPYRWLCAGVGGFRYLSDCVGGGQLGDATIRFRLVALDLDGTAVQSDGEVSKRLKKTVATCLNAGIHVILATGRMVQSAEPYWNDLGLGEGPLIAYQGAVVAAMPHKKVVAEVLMPERAARQAVLWATKRQLLTQVYVGQELWVSREDARVRQYIERNHIPAWVRGEREILDWPEPPIKLLFQDRPEVLDGLRPELERQLAGHPVRIFKSQPDYLEVVHQSVGKAVGLARAADSLGIPQDQVMAIGDAENDIDMLRWAGFGVAMGQAAEAVKHSADAVTASCDEDGASLAIERWVLQTSVHQG